MKKFILSLAMVASTMAVSAQSEAYVGDMNDDGELNISDVTQLVNTVIGKQAPRKVSLGGGDPYAVDNSAIAGTWRTTSGEVITFNADGTTSLGTGYTYEYMPQLGFIAVYDADGGCPLSYNVLKKTKDMLLLNTMAQTGGKFYYTSAMFVTAIKLSSTSVNLNTGQTHQLTATVTPANAKVPTLKWTSSSTGIATVDQTGLVTAKKGGEATITATSTDGTGVKATCTFNITQLVTSVTLSSTTLNVVKGSTFNLDATVLPSTANNNKLEWTSSSTASVVSLDDGLFYAKATGTSTITAAATDGSGKKATCKVTVLSEAPTGVSLSAKNLTIKPSGSAQLTATVTPSGASTATVIWTSSDPSIVTVDKTGKVTAVGTEGKATITATVAGSGLLVAIAEVIVVYHEYVDLGLPSGTLWATTNVGAESPEDYGNYYAWGETKAYGEEDTSNSRNYSYAGSYTKTNYDWGTYKWCNGSEYSLTKYNTSSGYGIVDNKTVLELVDDAAYVNWGENWRTPTYEELTELRTNCYWAWTTSYNGKSVFGYIVYKQKSTADKGKTHGSSYSYSLSDTHIFLPAARWLFYYGFLSYTDYASYWSSSLNENDPKKVHILLYSSSFVIKDNAERYEGCSVRPVRRQ